MCHRCSIVVGGEVQTVPSADFLRPIVSAIPVTREEFVKTRGGFREELVEDSWGTRRRLVGNSGGGPMCHRVSSRTLETMTGDSLRWDCRWLAPSSNLLCPLAHPVVITAWQSAVPVFVAFSEALFSLLCSRAVSPRGYQSSHAVELGASRRVCDESCSSQFTVPLAYCYQSGSASTRLALRPFAVVFERDFDGTSVVVSV